jgi:hypothetical protein
MELLQILSKFICNSLMSKLRITEEELSIKPEFSLLRLVQIFLNSVMWWIVFMLVYST